MKMISYHQFLPQQIDAQFIWLQRNAITINVTMFSAARIVIQQHFSQYERIIVLIAAALSAHQGELFAKGSTRSECRD